ncbi:MAG TPA: glycoside hydrolase family 15 protein [Blastocatellia bacterium]|nr:glycoside hydrolase family 15 protein [Blastocatellia bacterium]
MPRDIPVSNGTLLVTFDRKYRIRDFYFPHPGRENQSSGHPFRFGISVDGAFSWFSSDDWQRELKYLDETLVSSVTMRSDRFGVEVVCNDAVDFYENVYLRRVSVRNLTARPLAVRLFFHHDFRISETEIGDTAYFDPQTSSIIHYKRNRYFIAGCLTTDSRGFDQWATGNKDVAGAEGTWRDAEDGSLQGNPIAQGSVDSTIGVSLDLAPRGEGSLVYWIGAGKSYSDVFTLSTVIHNKSPESLIHRTADYWRAWVNKEGMLFDDLPPEIVQSFKRSLLVMRTNLDDNGAIIAANDGDVEDYNHDTYSYMWPRDGALTAYALDIAGFSELTRRFYTFTKDLINPNGYFLHKYTPDGTLGSSWHAWIRDGEQQLPIQEDETALIIWGLWKHYDEHRDIEFIADFYRPVITRAATFMSEYRDRETGLPLPSWDLWEERRGIHTFTVATVWAGLQAAARFADLFGERDLVDKYASAADAIKQGAVAYLYRPELGRFARTLKLVEGRAQAHARFEYDTTVDASLFSVPYFGMLDPRNPMVQSTVRAISEHLRAKTDVGGFARYERDSYYSQTNDFDRVPGNPWFVTTLWMAQYEIALARNEDELKNALGLIRWAIEHGLPSGVLAEQVHPFTGEPLSVSPLTWSHAQLVTAVMEYLNKARTLKLCHTCGQPAFDYARTDTDAATARLDDFHREP